MHRIFSKAANLTECNWRQLDEFDDHEFVIAVTDTASGLRAFVAVHSRALGMAHGGTRYKSYATETEALQDALNLSRAMSYKSALAGLPYGGAKAVIILDENTDRQAILAAYARKIEALRGLFHTGTDVGLIDDDIRYMHQFCQYMLGVSENDAGDLSTSKAASMGVYYAMKAAAQHRYGSDDLRNKVIGIKGLGKLGGGLAKLLAADGAKLLIADVDDSAVATCVEALPNSVVVMSSEIHKQPMDMYAPCALGQEFDAMNVSELQCSIIAGGANNQLASDEVGDQIAARGILYVPDYVANAGGLIFVSEELEADGFKVDRIKQRLLAISQTVSDILAEAQATNTPTHRVAVQHAETKIQQASA